ncbi:MAG: hypothetical protein E5X37_30160 [Mesorhizobium sp.]|uniref:hypothetical protein n=1 Tax=Mesorhizobium sp. TaxID=1871066 RepID=UPI0012017820|nr:hypothetical protein [Mesorhizobium sp.]TIR04276.1 MAG: hypothetical protein E5X37_30160 [Mesorhizobium sp.]
MTARLGTPTLEQPEDEAQIVRGSHGHNRQRAKTDVGKLEIRDSLHQDATTSADLYRGLEG